MTGIPSAALDDRIAIVGRAGYGKTNAAKVMAERLLELGARVCILDPTDAWWGLRLKPDGKTPAFPVAIFGGERGDLALNEHAGETVGAAIAGSSQSTIVSMADFVGENARRRFAEAFLRALYDRNREPLHLIVDEADTLAPQRPIAPLDVQVLARMQQIVRRGRIRGFVPWLLTQRPAVLSKDVLSQADALIAFNLTASQDRDAIGAWIEGQADKAEQRAILAGLPKLGRGSAMTWIPGRSILQSIAFPLSKTFDSGRSPKRGEARPTAKLQAIDVEGLRGKLQTVEVETKANDPKTLRAEIARLKAELAKRPAAEIDPAAIYAARQEGYREGFAAMAHHERDALERLREAGRKIGEAYAAFALGVEEAIAQAVKAAAHVQPSAKASGVVHRQAPFVAQPAVARALVRDTAQRIERAAIRSAVVAEGLTGPEQRILDALAWWAAIGVDRPSKIKVAIAANYSPNGGAFNNPLGRLRSCGLLDYPANGYVALTAEGSAKANAPGTPPTTTELHARVLGLLNGPQQKILEPLLAAYPGAMDRAELAAAAGYSPDGGAFNNPLGSLRTLGFIDYPSPGQVVALPILFVE